MSMSDLQRVVIARLAADLAIFRAGLRYAPGTPEAKQQQDEEEALKRAAFSRVGPLPQFGKTTAASGSTSGFPTLQLQTPGLSYKPRSFSLIDEKLLLNPLDAAPVLDSEKIKEEGGGTLQRKRGIGAASSGLR